MLYVLAISLYILLSNALTPEEVIECFDIIASEYAQNSNQTDDVLNVTTAAQWIESNPDEMNKLCQSAEMLQFLSNPIKPTNCTSPDDATCITEDTVFCEKSTIPCTPGEDYEELRKDLEDNIASKTILKDANEYSYTDGDAVSELLLSLEIADNVGNIFGAISSAFGEIPVLGGVLGAIDAGSNAAREATRKLLDKADLHDGVLMSQHLTALYNDRERIIANQKYLEKRMIELWNMQNKWLEIKFNDLFDQLNTIDKLLRTPSGQRPGWNDQTDLDNLFDGPTDVNIPSIQNTN